YGTGPYGIMGNEDVGQMSAWYILSSLGFHPVNVGDGRYWLGSPQFDKAVLRLDGNYHEGRTFTVTARSNSDENVYVQAVTLNGVVLQRPYILHEEITGGGELVFEMGAAPNEALWSNSWK
ncbi:MAG: glycoside hydrolase family 92 protein, partial [Xanthomonadales bacterium]|nr:glycoside hydrolase family 92 protein [Xanthomonadales bacterium]